MDCFFITARVEWKDMGVLVGIVNALAASFQNSRFKTLEGVHTHALNWLRILIGTIVIGIVITFFLEWQVPPLPFWLIMVGIILPAEWANSFLYVRAFQISPQSLVGPFFSFTALFLVPTGYIVLGELPTFVGGIGILFLVFGALFLGFGKGNYSFAGSIKKITQEKGALYMLAGAAIISISIVSAKFLFQYVSPLQFVFYMDALLVIVYTPLMVRHISTFRKGKWQNLALMSGAYTAGTILHFVGLSLLFAAYYISIKRLSILFDVIFGKVVHQEEHFYERLSGAALMVGGVVLIVLS
ncbi:MAG: EamA family transporter [Candidatus Niyogibacteria bacterium]|nr:EamA family transporter [Candidatus Niyogibacteria bacterium]